MPIVDRRTIEVDNKRKNKAGFEKVNYSAFTLILDGINITIGFDNLVFEKKTNCSKNSIELAR